MMDNALDLGSFTLCLAVKDLAPACQFYEAVGFKVMPPHPSWSPHACESYGRDWLVLENAAIKLALIQGSIECNTLTFDAPDVRAIQRTLKGRGIRFLIETDEDGSGPGHAVCIDPDGNPILFDQRP
jgi:lactoylglutathione lyase